MHLCEHNLTFAVYAVLFNNYLFAKDNVVQGALGQHTQRLINPRRSRRSLCTLVNEEKVGEKLPNGSYDGALGLIEKKLVDALLKPENAFIDSALVDFTQPMNSENYLISHPLKDPIKNLNDSAMLFEFSDIFFLLCCLAATAAFFFLSLGLLWTLRRDKCLKLALLMLKLIVNRHEQAKKVSLISLALIGLIIFYFFTKQIFLISIKTNKVVADTSKLINNEEKLFESDRCVVWLEGERERHLAMNSPVDTPLRRLYDTKNSDPILEVDKVHLDNKETLLDRGFFFLSSLSTTVMAKLLSQLFKRDFFINSRPFYSTYNVMYRIKEKSEKTRIIDTSVSQLSEAGFLEKSIYDLKAAKLLPTSGKNKIYHSLKDNIEDHTAFEPIKLNNLYYLFLVYFLVTGCLLVAFFAHSFFGWLIRFIQPTKLVKKTWNFVLFSCKKQTFGALSKIFVKKSMHHNEIRQVKSKSHSI